MGRVKTEIIVNGRKCWTLFDSGARHNYLVRQATRKLASRKLPYEKTAGIGGKEHKVKEVCLVVGKIDGHWVEFEANVVDEIGKDEKGRPIEVIFGALAMQGWGIELDLRNEKLDLTHYTTEFVEF